MGERDGQVFEVPLSLVELESTLYALEVFVEFIDFMKPYFLWNDAVPLEERKKQAEVQTVSQQVAPIIERLKRFVPVERRAYGEDE